jgi:enoyl-CoA hydratase/carnithine racemase
MAEESVLYEVGDDRVAVLTFNRADRMNALTEEMEDRYFDLLLQADADPEVRAIVVTGAGRAFCAGADLSILDAAANGEPLLLGGATRRPVTLPFTVRKPIVGAINGAAVGVGLALMLFHDVRFAAAGAKISAAFPQRGLVAEYDTSWLLPRIIGTGRALDLLLSARTILAEEAAEIGLVNWVVPADELLTRARAYAADLAANCSPASMAVIKQQVYADWDTPLAEAHPRTAALMHQAFTGPDFTEGIAAFLEKRPPAFPALGTGSNTSVPNRP